MSRIGKPPSPCPPASTSPSTGRRHREGPEGHPRAATVPGAITIRQDGDTLLVERPDDERQTRALHGLVRSLVNNMVVGVSEGFAKELEIVGTGYRAAAQGTDPRPVRSASATPCRSTPPTASPSRSRPPPASSSRGIDKEQVGQVAADIRSHPQARALQGQGRAVPRRARGPQGRQDREVGTRRP